VNLTDSTRAGYAGTTDGITSDNSFGLALSASEANSTVVYQQSADQITWTTATETVGSRSDGQLYYRAQVTDAAGNVSESNIVNATVDTTVAPATISTTIGTNSGLTQAIGSGVSALTKDNTWTITGTAEANSTVEIFEGATKLGDAVLTDTSWTYTTSTLSNAKHELTAKITDRAGNQTTTSAIEATVDAVAPTVTIATDDAALHIGDNAIITLTFSEAPVALPAVTASAGSLTPFTVSSTNPLEYTATLTPPADTAAATITFTVASWTDAAGNEGTIAASPATVAVDTVAPTTGTLSFANLVDTGTANTPAITQNRTFDLSLGAQEAGSSTVYERSFNGGAFESTIAAQSALADGNYEFRATVTDAAGNTTTTNTISVTVDNAAPTVGTLSFVNLTDSTRSGYAGTTDGITSDNSFGLTLSASEAGSTVVIKFLQTELLVGPTMQQLMVLAVLVLSTTAHK